MNTERRRFFSPLAPRRNCKPEATRGRLPTLPPPPSGALPRVMHFGCRRSLPTSPHFLRAPSPKEEHSPLFLRPSSCSCLFYWRVGRERPNHPNFLTRAPSFPRAFRLSNLSLFTSGSFLLQRVQPPLFGRRNDIPQRFTLYFDLAQ